MSDILLDPNAGANLIPEFQKAFQTAVTAEKKPIQTMETRKEKLQAKTDLLTEMVGRVDSLRQLLPGVNSPFAIRELAFNSDDPKVLSGSADKSLAEPGKHSLEVLQLAGGPAALTNRFEDRDETHVGTGYVTFATKDGDTKEIFVDYDNSTLEGIARTINDAKMGLQAAVITDESSPDSPYRLMVTSPLVGAKNDVVYPEFYFAGGEEDFYIDDKRSATNAIVKFQGFQIESPTNEIKDLITGATVNLKGITDPGKPTTISIEQDIPKTTVKVKDVVDRVNQILGFIQEQNTIDDKTDTSRTLGGDYALKLAQERIQSALSSNFLGVEGRSIQTLNDVGMQITRKGIVAFDEKKFEAALEKNFDQTVDFIAGDGQSYGVITKLSRALNTLVAPGAGLLTSQKSNYSGQMKAIDNRIEQTQARASARVEALRTQLAKAQSTINSMQSQAGYFQGQAA